MDDKQIKAIIALLDDDDPEVLAHIESQILAIGTDMVPHLEEAWENNFNPKLQKRIEDIVHRLQFEAVKQRLLDWKKGHSHDLLQGMWAVATYIYPDYELSALRQEVEQLYYDIWVEFKPQMHPFDQIKVLNSIFYNKLRFRANTKNFHSPSNSMVNAVIETRRGNPITLSVIYMLLAQRLKLPVYGVNLPNLFVLTYKNDDIQFYINTFNKGLIFSRADIDNFVGQLNLSPAPDYYEPCSHLDIVLRNLRNLNDAFERQGDTTRMEETRMLLELLEAGESARWDPLS
jgi:regulator of sirC expression with transglutaminase-like and TPR domain